MLTIGHHFFSSPFILAPLAGYSDLPFRLLCRQMGAGYCVSEMISCHGLYYRQGNTLRMLRSIPEERPAAFQLFGAEPDVMEEASKILLEFSPDIIDINMGCPVKKVTKKGAGAALMDTPQIAASIIEKVVAVAETVKVPVTVKMRLGRDSTHINVLEFAQMAQDCGAAAVIIHARTWKQAFAGTISAEYIGEVKSLLKVPVIGNGDILSREDGKKMLEETGCDGIMIGRGALGNPWIFSESSRPENIIEICKVALHHLDLLEQFLPAEKLPGYIKNQMSRYFKGVHGSSHLRRELFAADGTAAVRDLLKTLSLSEKAL